MGEERPPFLLREITPFGPAGFPPDVAPNGIIFASHINAIRDSVGLWPGHVNAQGHDLIALGAVGIGTGTPAASLHIAANSVNPSLVADTAGIYFAYASSICLSFGSYPTAPYSAWIQTKRTLNNGLCDPLSLNPLGGSVGIGTATPVSRLTVAADSVAVSGAGMGLAQVAIQSATDGNKNLWMGFDTTSNVGFIQPGISGVSWNALVLNPLGGYVGIGMATPNPSYRLEVNGHINIIGAGAAYHKNGVAVALGGTGVTKRTVVTEDRALDTVYQNAGEQARIVSATIAFADPEDSADAYTDEDDPPATLVGSTVGAVTLMFWVLPAHYYRVAASDPSAAISSWVEWE